MTILVTIGLTGAGGGVGGGVLRALRMSNLPHRLITMDTNPLAMGLYAGENGYLLPAAGDPQYKGELLRICQAEQIGALIVGTDPELLAVSAFADQLEAIGCIPICSDQAVNQILRDKVASAEFLRNAGFPFVETLPLAQAAKLVARRSFPLVVKPIDGSASLGVHVVFTQEELDRLPVSGPFLVQEYLVDRQSKRSRDQLRASDVYQNQLLVQRNEISIQVLVDQDGEVMGSFSSRNELRHGVPMIICPLSAEEREATTIAVAMARHLAAMGLRGPCNFQGKLTEEGPVFFELNPRFTGITGVRAAMGFHEVEACLRRLVLDEPLSVVQERLQQDERLICSRYVTEYLVPADRLDQMRRVGVASGDGWSTSI